MPTVVPLTGLLVLVALIAACAPLPQQVYLPRADGGIIEYSTCAFNSHVPVGVALHGLGVKAHIQLGERDGRKYVEMRLEVPAGKTLMLQSSTFAVDTVNPINSLSAKFPTASLVDTPIVNSTSEVAAVRNQQLSPTAKLVGGSTQEGRSSSDRNFWFATYIGVTSAEEITVKLPSFTVDEIPYTLPPVHFTRKSMVIVALLNC